MVQDEKLRPDHEPPGGREVADAGADGESGQDDGRRKEADQARRLLESGLFDPLWYVANHPDAAASDLPAVIHYLRIGAARGYPPSARFDGADYLSRYPDVHRSGINPLLHFVTFGRKEGRTAKAVNPEDVHVRLVTESGLFDEAWYRASYPDAADPNIDAVRHFLRHGRERGHSPGPLFDAADYLTRHVDVASSKINPLLHYLLFGRAEGRSFQPVSHAHRPHDGPGRPSAPLSESGSRASDVAPVTEDEAAKLRLLATSGLFDAEWYARRHPEVAASGLDPLLHYLRKGGSAGLAPSPAFDGANYLARYRDVKAAGANPLVHYLMSGRKEGRKITPADPDEMIVRLIRDSGLFDEAWYLATYPDAAASGLTPIDHFRKHGRHRALNPGPGFDSASYIAEHMGDAPATLNPLVHYLMIGRARGLRIRSVAEAAASGHTRHDRSSPGVDPADKAQAMPPSAQDSARDVAAAGPTNAATSTETDISPEDILLIETSPFFDKAWYVARYPEVARLAMSPAEHYLRHGTRDMRSPSLLFDAPYYVIEQCPEIQQTGVNPLLHFLKVGRARGLKPRALLEATDRIGPGKPVSPTSWPLAASGPSPEPEPKWQRQADLSMNSPNSRLMAGRTLLAHAPTPGLLAEAADRLAVFRKMCGLCGESDLRLSGPTTDEQIGHSGFRAETYTGLGEAFRSGTARLADAWHASSRLLRLRFGDDESPRPGTWLVVRAFQCESGSNEVRLLGEALLAPASPSFVDLQLADRLMPVLLVISSPEGCAEAIGLLPFPSLCRGGLHHAELVADPVMADPMNRLQHVSDTLVRALMAETPNWMLGRIRVDLRGATGNEPVFSGNVLAWLDQVFGIRPEAEPERVDVSVGERYLRRRLAEHFASSSSRRVGACRLILPPDAIPTLAALVAPAPQDQGIILGSSFLVTDETSLKPRLAVYLPQDMADLMDLQPVWARRAIPVIESQDDAAPAGAGNPPLPPMVIRLAPPPASHRAAMLLPLAPDIDVPVLGRQKPARSGTVDVVIRTSSGTAPVDALLDSLLAQQGATLAHVWVEVAGQADTDRIRASLETCFPGRFTLETVTRHRPISASLITPGTGSRQTLVLDGNTVLHDPRTLATLLGAIQTHRTASAACVVLRETAAGRGTTIGFESGGYFPSHVSLLAAPRLILTLPDVRGALPEAVYPVIANDDAVLLLDNEALAACGTIADADGAAGSGVAFSLKALALGYRHLCVSAVRAVCIGNPPPRELADPPGITTASPFSWESALRTITILRELQ